MQRAIMIASAMFLASNAQAQVADRLSRGMEPNAIDRSLSQPSSTAPDLGTSADADRIRAEQAARDAASRRGLPATSTLADGPTGVQRLGTTALPATPAPAAPPPAIPQP